MAEVRKLSLVADVGGTNARVALAEGAKLRPESTRRYRNADHSSLESVLHAYLSEEGSPELEGICVALAGPVRDGAAQMTNLDWSIDAQALARDMGCERAILLNDLQAQGHALGRIAADRLRPIIVPPDPVSGATQLVIGVGTGFNAAPVHDTPAGRLVAPSECGHAGLPVATEEDLRLSLHMARMHGFASVEEVLSGPGLAALDAFLSDGQERTAKEVVRALTAGEPRAQATGRAFARLLGSVAGDLALTHLPFGGLWLVGGVSVAFAQHLARLGFVEAFRDKGRFSGFLEQFAVAAIEDDFAALAGCAACLAAAASR